LLGEREFFGLNFKVTPATLIPRQDTELLVETALERIPEQGDFKVLDMGVGSGAIAISIAYARSNASVIGVDYSEAAIEVAQINVSHFQLSNLRLILSNWYSELQGHRFDLIVSNPPYIAIDDSHLDQGDLCFEPRSALVSGENGLSDIKYICLSAHEFLHERGWLMLEHGYNQATEVRALLQQQGYSGIFTALDLAGLERVTGGQLLKSVELIDSSIF
jgi:release factor glutamine methyltransferase